MFVERSPAEMPTSAVVGCSNGPRERAVVDREADALQPDLVVDPPEPSDASRGPSKSLGPGARKRRGQRTLLSRGIGSASRDGLGSIAPESRAHAAQGTMRIVCSSAPVPDRRPARLFVTGAVFSAVHAGWFVNQAAVNRTRNG